MKLHIFNPEHDIALAYNDKYFTAPRAGRCLREDCGFLPALWADKEDYVLVNNIDNANKSLKASKLSDAVEGKELMPAKFITISDLRKLPKDIIIEPWGWDCALCFQLQRNGISPEVLPNDNQLEDIRRYSNRRFSQRILSELRSSFDEPYSSYLVGKSTYVTRLFDLENAISAHECSVVKEPWSSSGRGVRYVGPSLDEPTTNWARNIIIRQGGLMVEPYYKKVLDFGMEFVSDNAGVHYRGLSLFKAENGFYEGNIIASENEKWQALTKLLPANILLSLRQRIEEMLGTELMDLYIGPLGVDMMVVEGSKVHPMVEINLRRTMGHVAIDLFDRMETCSIMRIVYSNGCYRLEINPITDNIINCCQPS